MRRLDPDHLAFRRSLAKLEAPFVMLRTAMTIVALTLLYALAFPYQPSSLLLHIGETALLLMGAWIASRPWCREAWVPWLMLVCALGIAGGFMLENLWEPSTIGMAFLILIIVSYSSFILELLPVIVGAVPMIIGTALVAASQHPNDGPRWAIAAFSAVVLGAVLRQTRLHALDQLGEALARNATLATLDPLTELFNRRGVEEHLGNLHALAARGDQHLFVAVIDIDGLKRVNDEHGHELGDVVIRAVASGLRLAMRDSDLLGRWGGDEFIVIGMGQPFDPDLLTARIHESVLVSIPDRSQWPGIVSIGVASAPATQFAFEEALRIADADMYQRRRARRSP